MSEKSVPRKLSSGHQAGVWGSLIRGKQDPTPVGLKDPAGHQGKGRKLGSAQQSKDRDKSWEWSRRTVSMRGTNWP